MGKPQHRPNPRALSIMDDLDSLDELGSRIEKEVEKALKTLEVGKAKK